jgi:2-polyprenyl-3-methyl-5-hydroxy-6-metoxy-1,4-benzoquinol methylase
MTTETPDADTLRAYLAAGFRGTPKDGTHHLALLAHLGVPRGASVLDFGASWGYFTYQLRDAGYNALGFEVAQRRAQFGSEKLGVRMVHREEDIPDGIDVFFASHVIEHIPAPCRTFLLAKSKLVEGGLLVLLTPNGCSARMQKDPRAYHRSWGLPHPICLDDEFYSRAFPHSPKLLTTSPIDYGLVSAWNRRQTLVGDLSGAELLFVACV